MRNTAALIIFIFSLSMSIAQINSNQELINCVDGKTVKLANSRTLGVVLVFMSNQCPHATYYVDRLMSLEAELDSEKIKFFLVNAYSAKEESVAQMKEYASTHKLGTYLVDKEQQLKKALGVRKSPEAVLLKRNGDQLIKFYQGPIDNNPQVATDVSETYLKNNIDRLLSNQTGVKSSMPVVGCFIK